MVNGEVALLEDGGQLELVGGYLVMACLAGDAKLQGFDLQVLHEGGYTAGDGAEVVVVHLLVLGRVMSHEGAACHYQVGACGIEVFINEEILLFPS